MVRSRIEQVLNFDNLHAVVIGDVMLDEYILGSAKRISPEAPVPIVELASREHRLGGAGNVAINTCSLGAKTTLIGLIGDDANGQILTQLTKDHQNLSSYLIKDGGRKTTCKTRILASSQHLLRVDNEDRHDIPSPLVEKVEKMLKFIHHSTKIDVIILQDYNKGFFSAEMIQMLLSWSKSNGILTALDPKLERVSLFKGVDIFKPNLKEVIAFLGHEVAITKEDLQSACSQVALKMESELVVITLSADGICSRKDDAFHWESSSIQSIVDVSGAGDTVISLVALLYANKDASIEEITLLANLGGGAVCRLPGVAVVDNGMILDVIELL